MKIYNDRDVQNYKSNDWILELMLHSIEEEERFITTNRWLLEDINKRMIYADVYGDILRERTKSKILDVGGGINTLTKVLAQNSDYQLIDILAHGGEEYLRKHRELERSWKAVDWYQMELGEDKDIIIANDIFPNVDQRVELFIEKMLPHCRELRMIITYYNIPHWYVARRSDAEEILTVLCYDGATTAMKLQKFEPWIMDAESKDWAFMKEDRTSIYPNGRQVVYIRMRGSIREGEQRPKSSDIRKTCGFYVEGGSCTYRAELTGGGIANSVSEY